MATIVMFVPIFATIAQVFPAVLFTLFANALVTVDPTLTSTIVV